MKHRITSLAAAGVMAAVAALSGPAAHADTLVNIKGYGDDGAGANIYAYPVAPGQVVSFFNPVLVDLKAGDYWLADAWGQPGALYDAWNFQLGAAGSWGTHYVVGEPLGGGQYAVLLDSFPNPDPSCSNHFCAWSTEAESSAAFLAAAPARLHIDHDMTVAFVSADYYLPDNAGGISLSVSAVPEPATAALLLAGLGGIGWAARRRSCHR